MAFVDIITAFGSVSGITFGARTAFKTFGGVQTFGEHITAPIMGEAFARSSTLNE